MRDHLPPCRVLLDPLGLAWTAYDNALNSGDSSLKFERDGAEPQRRIRRASYWGHCLVVARGHKFGSVAPEL